MGACAILPRIIGHGRAAELLFTGRDMSADEGFAWGFYNRVVRRRAGRSAGACALELAQRAELCPCGDQDASSTPNGMCRSRRRSTWRPRRRRDCMETSDFHRAYEAFAEKRTPEFQGD